MTRFYVHFTQVGIDFSIGGTHRFVLFGAKSWAIFVANGSFSIISMITIRFYVHWYDNGFFYRHSFFIISRANEFWTT